ncbi:MAG: HlyD family efflux transporter periplasmic adaptor subunit, partial [Planctomycetaceae bacterium]|nr:HlyD family efflux transporter periplasmic adaptor subunit [Planctomycetaceae bacterium]
MKIWLRRLPLLLIAGLLSGLLIYGFWPIPVKVNTVSVEKKSFPITVNDDGKTRIREKYIVSAPVSGKLFRIELDEGDLVEQGTTVLAQIEPSDPALLDARAEAEAEARVRAAKAAVQLADASLQHAKHAYDLAEKEYGRAQNLLEKNAITTSELDQTEHQEAMAMADLRSAEFSVAVARFEQEQAEAALIRTRPRNPESDQSGIFTITSPIHGQVLRVFEENAGVVTPGIPLMELGDPHDLEMEIDVLSTDAVRIHPGATVLVNHWGGEKTLEGTVRVVEPSAFLKVSALGVEEQRVNVIANFSSPFEDRMTLGDGFRIEASI